MEDNNGYVYTLLHIWMDVTVLYIARGGSRIFQGGLETMVIIILYKLYYIYIFHIIILNEVHCNLLKAIDA